MIKEYVLTNGTKFIKRNFDGQYSQVNNLTLADTFKTQQSAKNFMLNSLPVQLSRSYYVAKVEDGQIIRCTVPKPEKPIHKKYNVTYKQTTILDDSDWCKNFIGLDDVFKKALKRGSKVAQELSDIDLEICDLEHFIEFKTLDVFTGYKAYKKMHDLLVKRRELKNEHKIIGAINNNQVAAENISNILCVIKECKQQTYSPRKSPKLFEVGLRYDEEVV